MKTLLTFALGLGLGLTAAPLRANDAIVESVTVDKAGDRYTFNVTVRHPDTGWDHYVDAWRILDREGNVLGVRDLAHPHVNEQPFTRSLSNVKIPQGVAQVVIEAHDNVDGWSPRNRQVTLP